MSAQASRSPASAFFGESKGMKLTQAPAALAIAAIYGISAYPAIAQDQPENDDLLPQVTVSATPQTETTSEKSGSYTVKSTSAATRLDTSLRETPQSISVITRAQMTDFHLTTVNDALDFTTGIKVERAETDRIYYTARGSDVTNFQIDGIGAPMAEGLTFGDLDTAIYDRIEVLRGANGLLSGTGNPSATVNFIRKRPTADFQAHIDLSAGSWDHRRAEGDFSGPLNEAGNVRGRVVLVNQNRNSYLDRYSSERNVAYGIVEADITENTQVVFGHTYHQNDSDGVLWGALPLVDESGNPRHFKRSDSTGANWSRWDALNNITFAELAHFFDNGWTGKFQLTRKELTSNADLFYVLQLTGPTGLLPYAGNYRSSHKELTADAYLSGPFTLAGRDHELVIGATWSRQTIDEKEKSATIPPFLDVDSIADIPQPVFTSSGFFTDREIKRLNTYAAAKFNVTDRLKVTTGANMLTYKLNGTSYLVEQNAEAHNKITPYAGLVYKIDDIHSAYASYAGIYNPQTSLTKDLKPIAPVEGKNYEVGIKSEFFNKKLNTSFALFKNVQQNVAEQAGFIGATTYYEGINATTTGFEIDIAGEVSPNLNLTAGFTNLFSLKDEDHNNVKPYTPRRIVRLAAVYKVPQFEKLKVGANINWQDDIHTTAQVLDDTTFEPVYSKRIKQGSYAIVNLMANYELDSHWSAGLNVYNLTNEKYYSSLMWDQSFYGAPRNAMATLTWKY